MCGSTSMDTNMAEITTLKNTIGGGIIPNIIAMDTGMVGATTVKNTISVDIIFGIIAMVTGSGTGFGSRRIITKPRSPGIGIIRENMSGESRLKRLFQKATGKKRGSRH